VDFPIVTIQLQNMKHQIMQAFVDHQADISKEVERQLEGCLKDFDMAFEVRKVLRPLFERALQDSLKSAVYKALYSEDVGSVLQTEVHAALLKVLKEYYPHEFQYQGYEVGSGEPINCGVCGVEKEKHP